MKLRKYNIFWVRFIKELGKGPEGVVKTLNNERERGGYSDHSQRDFIRADSDYFQLYSTANIKRGEILNSN